MRVSRQSAIYWALLAASFAVALTVSWTSFGAQIDNDAYDWMFRLYRPPAWTTESILLAIDEPSLNAYGGVPGLRKPLAQALRLISAAAPKAVAVDLILAHPGKLVGTDDALPIIPDAIIFYDEENDKYEIEMANDPAPNLFISGMYRKMLKDRSQDKKTREFLSNNVRNARWLLESIEQRKSTIMRVIRAVVDAQRAFELSMRVAAAQLGFEWSPGDRSAPSPPSSAASRKTLTGRRRKGS